MTEDVTSRARRALLAATALIAPLLIVASTLIMPPGTDTISDSKADNLALLATVSRHRDKTAFAGLLVVFALLSLVPFVAGLAGAVRERGAWLAGLGAAMAVAGCFSAAVVNGFWFVNVKATDPSLSASRDAVAQLIGLGHWSGYPFAVLRLVVLPLGWVLLAVALGRSRLAPWWMAALFGVSLPVLMAAPNRWAALAGLLLLAAFLPLAPVVAGRRPAPPAGLIPTRQPAGRRASRARGEFARTGYYSRGR
jgi:hypothetical protein